MTRRSPEGNGGTQFALGFICGVIAILILLGILNVPAMIGGVFGAVHDAEDTIDACIDTESSSPGHFTVLNPSLKECNDVICHPEAVCRGSSLCKARYLEQCDCCRAKYGSEIE